MNWQARSYFYQRSDLREYHRLTKLVVSALTPPPMTRCPRISAQRHGQTRKGALCLIMPQIKQAYLEP